MSGREHGPGQPPWMPAADVLPAVVPAGCFLLRTERMIVALSHIAVYPNGCMFEVHLAARGDALPGGVPDGVQPMMFAVRFGTGVAVTVDDAEQPPTAWRDGQVPMLMQYGYQASSSAGDGSGDGRLDAVISLWLHPVPPPEPGLLSVTAPDLGPRLTTCPLDGQALHAAAGRAQPYWPSR